MTEENLRKNNSKRAYQLVTDLTTAKQGKATTVQDRPWKCHTEERHILTRWTEYCSVLYNHKVNGDPSVLNCPQTDIENNHQILRKFSWLVGILSRVNHRGLYYSLNQCSICLILTLHASHQTTNCPKATKSVLTQIYIKYTRKSITKFSKNWSLLYHPC